jgi:hypothetical protein
MAESATIVQVETEASDALRAHDLARLLLCLEARPALATSDAPDIQLDTAITRRMMRMPLLAAAIYHAVLDPAGMPLLNEVAARYASTHRQRAMHMRFQYQLAFVRTPLSWLVYHGMWSPQKVATGMCLLDHGLTDVSNVADMRHGVLCDALWGAYTYPQFIARMLRAGIRLEPGEDEDAITYCLGSRTLDQAEASLRTLLPVYAGRMVLPIDIAQWVAIFAGRRGSSVVQIFRLLDVLRALGLRLTPAVREVLARVEGLLAMADAADAERVRRTLLARRMLSRSIGVRELSDAIASVASEGETHSHQLVVVQRRHRPTPVDA